MPKNDRALERAVGPVLLGVGVYSVALGLFMALAPGAFHEALGPFGPRNDHYTRDAATIELTLGFLLLVAVRRPSWRVPALAATAVRWALHAVSHLIDVGAADPTWVGVVDAVALVLGTGMLVVVLRAAHVTRSDGVSS